MVERLALGLIIMVISVSGCANEKRDKPKESVKPQPPSREAGDETVQHKVLSFNLEGLDNDGGKKWEVNGKSAESISETEIKLNEITAKTYGEAGETTITADQGVYDKSKNNVRLEKNVKATIENAQSMGPGFIDFSSLTQDASKPKDAVPKEAKKTRTVITCDGEVEFDYERNKACFNENVKVAGDDGNIDADKLTVNLDPTTKKIHDIVAEGSVKITRGENIAYSDKATYIEGEKKVVLTGRPKLVLYEEDSPEEDFFGK